MKTITVKVQRDHLETLSKVKKPIFAIAELIWNGLDANANNVNVRCKYNKLGAIDSIIIKDNGHGLNIDDAEVAFRNLGPVKK